MELSQLPVRSRKDGARANQNLPGAKEITRVNVKGGPNITSSHQTSLSRRLQMLSASSNSQNTVRPKLEEHIIFFCENIMMPL